MKFIVLLAITLAVALSAPANCPCGLKGLDAAKACVDSTVANCYNALQTDNAKCATCKADFFPDVDGSAATCTAVPTADKVTDCKFYNKDKKCIACVDGKYLGSDGKCAAEIADCETHSGASTAVKCEKCKNEKKIKADKSACEAGTAVSNCASYAPATDPKCTGCNQKYWLSSGACKAVTSVDNCALYKTTADECFTCNSGYFLENKACVKYTVDKCLSGTAKDKCTLCDGFAPKADGSACDVAITADANCFGFIADKSCSSCKSGYGADKDNKCTVKCPTTSGGSGGSDASILKALVLPIVLVIALLI